MLKSGMILIGVAIGLLLVGGVVAVALILRNDATNPNNATNEIVNQSQAQVDYSGFIDDITPDGTITFKKPDGWQSFHRTSPGSGMGPSSCIYFYKNYANRRCFALSLPDRQLDYSIEYFDKKLELISKDTKKIGNYDTTRYTSKVIDPEEGLTTYIYEYFYKINDRFAYFYGEDGGNIVDSSLTQMYEKIVQSSKIAEISFNYHASDGTEKTLLFSTYTRNVVPIFFYPKDWYVYKESDYAATVYEQNQEPLGHEPIGFSVRVSLDNGALEIPKNFYGEAIVTDFIQDFQVRDFMGTKTKVHADLSSGTSTSIFYSFKMPNGSYINVVASNVSNSDHEGIADYIVKQSPML